MLRARGRLFLWGLALLVGIADGRMALSQAEAPYLLVLGIAQDAGAPQAGVKVHPGWDDPSQRRFATSLALIDPRSGDRWLFDCTPDFPEQLHRFDRAAPHPDTPGLSGIFLTHAHMGHYTGLMFLGHESMGSREVPVYAMPRMTRYLEKNGPWSQLVEYRNIALEPLENGRPVKLADDLWVTPFLVPHRQEYSEVVGFRIEGPSRTAIYLPDIDKWEEWDAWGVFIEDLIAASDVAYLDGTFFADGEIPGRDMSGFPHPFIAQSLERFREMPAEERGKIRFIHLNHTNPALLPDGEARTRIEAEGYRVAEEGERVDL